MRILIFYPQDICYGIVDTFADNFSKALQDLGVEIYAFDHKKDDTSVLVGLLGSSYDAIIDFYSGLAASTLGDGVYLMDALGAPVFQVYLDFPVYISDVIDAPLKNAYALCMDKFYIEVIKDYLPHIKGSFFFPMAGTAGTRDIPWRDRKNDVAFIGTYTDYRQNLALLDDYDEDIRALGTRFFEVMKEHPELNQKDAFINTLNDFNISLSDSELYQWIKMIGGIARSAFSYHRENMIAGALESEAIINVYGDSWKEAPFANHPRLCINPAIRENEYIRIMEDTKISLNIMYSNKSAFSERLAYSMLNKSVCLVDESDYLMEEYGKNGQMAFYSLKNPSEVGLRINELLSNPSKTIEISKRAYERAKAEHTWDDRAVYFLDILKEIS